MKVHMKLQGITCGSMILKSNKKGNPQTMGVTCDSMIRNMGSLVEASSDNGWKLEDIQKGRKNT